MKRIEIGDLKKRDRGFYYALPALCLAAFHMIVAYAVLPVGPGFKNGDFLPGLLEGLIGIVLYGGLACCVIMAIVKKRFSAVLEFIGIITVARLLLPIIGAVGGEFIIGFVIVSCALVFVGGAISLVMSAFLTPVFGGLAAAGLTAAGVVYFLLPVMGVIVIITMVVSALTGAFEGVGLLGKLFTDIIPLL